MNDLISTLLEKLILNIPWPEILADALKYSRKVFRGSAHEGIYEVIRMEHSLELLNEAGTQAHVTKKKRVKYLQENTIAYQDISWGDGKLLLNYRCTPGQPVDQYRLGYKTFVLISLREQKSRGDIDEYNIQWDIQGGFLVSDGFWETEVNQKTKELEINVTFPKTRSPSRIVIVESNQHRTILLKGNQIRKLRDGRTQVTWTKKRPRLYEHYLMKWDW